MTGHRGATRGGTTTLVIADELIEQMLHALSRHEEHELAYIAAFQRSAMEETDLARANAEDEYIAEAAVQVFERGVLVLEAEARAQHERQRLVNEVFPLGSGDCEDCED